jgi:hypothetical protein
MAGLVPIGANTREPDTLWFETRRFATLLTMRIASIDLILRSARRARLEGEVVHSAILPYVSAYGVRPGHLAYVGIALPS